MSASRAPLLLGSALAASLLFVGCGSQGDAPAPAAGGGSGGSPAAGPAKAIDICAKVTPEEIAAILGGPVTRKDVPGGGCDFSQDDPRAPSVGLAGSSYDEGTGGFDGAVTGIKGVLEGTDDQAVEGVGTEAFIATGTAMGGENQQASGVVHVGDSLVQVTVIQGKGLPADQVRGLARDLLALSASKG